MENSVPGSYFSPKSPGNWVTSIVIWGHVGGAGGLQLSPPMALALPWIVSLLLFLLPSLHLLSIYYVPDAVLGL